MSLLHREFQSHMIPKGLQEFLAPILDPTETIRKIEK